MNLEQSAGILGRLRKVVGGGKHLHVIAEDGSREELPLQVTEVLDVILSAMSSGDAVIVFQEQELLSTTEAAKVLGVSRPFLAELLDSGVIPGCRVGTHRRVKAADLMAHLERRQRRTAALDQLNDEIEAAGMADSLPGCDS